MRESGIKKRLHWFNFITNLIRISLLCPLKYTVLLCLNPFTCCWCCRHCSGDLHHSELIVQSHKIGLCGSVHDSEKTELFKLKVIVAGIIIMQINLFDVYMLNQFAEQKVYKLFIAHCVEVLHCSVLDEVLIRLNSWCNSESDDKGVHVHLG